MTKDYHLTREGVRKLAIEAGFTMGRHDSPALLDMLNALVNAALDKVLGEPVAGYIKDKDGLSISFEKDLIEQGIFEALYAPRRTEND